RIPFPLCHRTAVVKRIVVISTKLALLRTAICINDAIVTIATSDEYEDALPVAVFSELNSVRKLELTRPARRHAIQEHRVVFQNVLLPKLVQIPRPLLKRRHLVHIADVLQQTILIHLNGSASLNETDCGRICPIS